MTGMIRKLVLAALVLTVTVAVAGEKRTFELSSLFTDHMVFQRDARLPVWGWSEPGVKVSVSLDGKSASAVTGKDGKWLVWLPAMKAGGPYELKIDHGKEIVIKDVMVGDVWICSGQSNMEWRLSNTKDSDKEIAASANKMLRHIKVEKNAAAFPAENFTGAWEVADPTTSGLFTAVGYYFGKEIQKDQKVVVGLINTSWGGTRVEPWTSFPTASKNPLYNSMIEARKTFIAASENIEARAEDEKLSKAYKKAVKEMTTMEKDSEYHQKFAAPGLDDSDWKFINTPDVWDNQGYKDIKGEAWYRKTVAIPADWAGKDLLLSPGAVDEIEVTFFNGQRVGSRGSFMPRVTEYWNKKRVYNIPGNLVKGGQAVIAVKVLNFAGAGGMFSDGDAGDMYLKPADGSGTPLSLAGKWRFKFTYVMPDAPKGNNGQRVVSALFNGMVNPLIPFPVSGAIWYQGESNASNAYDYRVLFPTMINDWRALWGRDFPFYWVQLANFRAPQKTPEADSWAIVRESQNEALKLPNTGTAVIIDIGEEGNIHPKNKKDVGYRLSLAARAGHYGQKGLVYSGPMYKSMKVEGDKIRIDFEHVGGGLVAEGGELKRFAIAGEDQKFAWAEAKIDGNSVLVWSEKVKNPVAVRYAFETNPEGANLYNKEGLPASPFRTDSWNVPTQK